VLLTDDGRAIRCGQHVRKSGIRHRTICRVSGDFQAWQLSRSGYERAAAQFGGIDHLVANLGKGAANRMDSGKQEWHCSRVFSAWLL